MMRRVLAFSSVLMPCMVAWSAFDPGAPYVSKGPLGSEPNERCTYDPWIVQAPVPVFERPTSSARILFRLPKGDKVHPIKQEVHVAPGLAKIIAEKKSDYLTLPTTGTVVYLRRYIGEGVREVWFNGKSAQMDIDLNVFDTPGVCPAGATAKDCWLEVIKPPVEEWWAFVHSPTLDKDGWILPSNDNLDTCNERPNQPVR